MWRFFKGVEGLEWPTLHWVKLVAMKQAEAEMTMVGGAKGAWKRLRRCVQKGVPPGAERSVGAEVEDVSMQYYMTFEGFVEVWVTVISPWMETRPFADE